MFQNIYTKKKDENIKEGFEFFDSFDMDKDRQRLTFGNSRFNSRDISTLLQALHDIILCPFYTIDSTVESVLQQLLSVFVLNQCEDVENTSVEIDMADLIDPDLLYTKEGFECTNDKATNEKNVQSDINEYSKSIKKQLYRILFLPVIIHIFYNIYYMFFFKDMFGNRMEFIDIEKKYYEPYLKEYSDYFLGLAIKPVSVIRFCADFISHSIHRYKINEKIPPYITYILLFLIIQTAIEKSDTNIISMIGDLLRGKSTPFNGFSFFVMGFFFIRQLYNRSKELFTNTSDIPVTLTSFILSAIFQIVYWIGKIIITMLMIQLSAYLCCIYFIAYMFFGIFISQSKDVFEVYKDIFESVIDTVYALYDPVCGTNSTFWYFVQFISKYCVIYLFEIAVLFILCSGIMEYSNINNVSIQSFVIILNFTGLFIFGIWCFMKYRSTVKVLDEKYSIVNIDTKTKNDNAKKEAALQKKQFIINQSVPSNVLSPVNQGPINNP